MYDFAAQSRDEIIIDMMQTNGWTMNKATNEYVKAKKAAGFQMGVVSRKDDAYELMIGMDLESPIDPKAVVESIVDELGVAESTARDYLKAYAKDKGLEIASGKDSQPILDWIVANAPIDGTADDWVAFDKEFIAWGTEEGRTRSNLNEYRKGIKLHLMLSNR